MVIWMVFSVVFLCRLFFDMNSVRLCLLGIFGLCWIWLIRDLLILVVVSGVGMLISCMFVVLLSSLCVCFGESGCVNLVLIDKECLVNIGICI